MVEDRRNGERDVLAGTFHVRRPVSGEEMDLARSGALGQSDAHLLRADRNQLANRPFHHHGVGEVHEVHGYGVLLPPHGQVQDTGTGDPDRRFFVRGPLDGIAQQFEVVHAKDFPERAVNVPGEINNAPTRGCGSPELPLTRLSGTLPPLGEREG